MTPDYTGEVLAIAGTRGGETMKLSTRISAILATAFAAFGLVLGAIAIQDSNTVNQAGNVTNRP
jgi:preprotein translocase subunit SecG